MGRREASVKDHQPVPLPHDGPLARLLESREPFASSRFEDDAVVASALRLLRPLTVGTGASPATSAAEESSHCLLRTLMHASSVEEQLQSLQRFKSLILQRHATDGSDPHRSTTDEDGSVRLILLELSLGSRTTPPLRRALQYTLDAMAQALPLAEDSALRWETALDSMLASVSHYEDSWLFWKEPLTTLQHALAYSYTAGRIAPSVAIDCLGQHARTVSLDASRPWSKTTADETDKAAQIANIFKSIHRIPSAEVGQLVELQQFFYRVITFVYLPVDHLKIVVVAYGKAQTWTAESLHLFLQTFLPTLTDTQQVYLLQGILVSIDGQLLMERVDDGHGESFLHVFLASFQRLAQHSPDAHIRVAALKGVRTLLLQCETGLAATRDDHLLTFLTNQTLQIVLDAWDSPDRRLANALPSLFQAILRLMHHRPQAAQLEALVRRVLEQPLHCKGRYIALDTLLPELGAQSLLDCAGDGLIDELLLGVADHGHNTVAIADLWARLLKTLLEDRMQEATAGSRQKSAKATEFDSSSAALSEKSSGKRTAAQSPSKNDCKERQPKSSLQQGNLSSLLDMSEPDGSVIATLDEWMKQWVPSLARALVEMEATRRKQIASFCLDRITMIVGGSKVAASKVFQTLITEINSLRLAGHYELPLQERDTLDDRILWASLMSTIAAADEGLILVKARKGSEGSDIRKTIARHISHRRLCLGLVHSSLMIRTSAFSAITAIVACQNPEDDAITLALKEAQHWEESLMFAAKDVDKHCLSSLFHKLVNFLDRLSTMEAVYAPGGPCLHHLSRFAIEFLIQDLLLNKTGYAGCPSSKATFALALLESMIVFSARDSWCAKTSVLIPKSGALYTRTIQSVEQATFSLIRKNLLSSSVLHLVVTLLHSSWDDTRARAYSTFEALVRLSHQYQVELPPVGLGMRELEAYAIHLASSPRQQECDTGARLLVVCGIMGPIEKEGIANRLLSLIDQRLKLMRHALQPKKDGHDILDSKALPLVHGLIRALRLILTDEKSTFFPNKKTILEETIEVLYGGLLWSLSVVADVNEGPESDTAIQHERSYVNPGALGANGIAGALKRVTAEEQARRVMSQRLIIGSWLLTKDACEALASTLALSIALDSRVFDKVGALLLKTQISVKHTGAAFAAHKALQLLSATCLRSDDETKQSLPTKWVTSLLLSVSDTGKVRNSTLRRSTGYALGFLALMRSDMASQGAARSFSQRIVNELLKLSLPPATEIRKLLEQLNLSESAFPLPLPDGDDSLEECKTRRIHALNILRLILLDAPLSNLSVRVAGDALVSAIIGYLDPEWAVRNSATMVFSAAMLRVVDPSKNAHNVDITGSRAANISELCNLYPSILSFIEAVLTNWVSGSLHVDISSALPPGLPLMTFLARVQPIRISGTDAALQTQPLIPPLVESMSDKHMAIRKAATRALANLACGDHSSPTSPLSMMLRCNATISACEASFNKIHGALCLSRELLRAHSGLVGLLPDGFIGKVAMLIQAKPMKAPTILAVALEVLDVIGPSDLVEKSHQTIIHWLETQSDSFSCGTAELGAIAGAGACKQHATALWRTSDASVTTTLDNLMSLLSSPSFDIRCAAIKTFKKSIYKGIDGWLANAADCHDRIQSLLTVLLKLLMGELGEKAHPPNVRRLSRCVLECLDTRLRMERRVSLTLNTAEQERLWKTAVRMLVGVDIDSKVKDYVTALDGNAAEMMAHALRGSSRSDSDLHLFGKLVARLSDPYLTYRLRLSSAVALSTSGVLMETDLLPTGLRRSFFVTSMWLMQDADADVRNAMARTSGCPNPSDWDYLSASDFILQRRIAEATIGQFSLTDVMTLALVCTESLGGTLQAFISEFDSIMETSADLLNIGSERKIFEEETPNDYFEVGFPVQLMLDRLLRTKLVLSQEDKATAGTLLLRCESILKLLSRQRLENEILDVTCDRRVFPFLHCLLLVSAAVLMLMEDDEVSKSVQYLAAQSRQRAVHSHVRQVLDVMRHQSLDFDARRQGIAECCFLLLRKRPLLAPS